MNKQVRFVEIERPFNLLILDGGQNRQRHRCPWIKEGQEKNGRLSMTTCLINQEPSKTLKQLISAKDSTTLI